MPVAEKHDPAYRLLAQCGGTRLGFSTLFLKAFDSMLHEAPTPFIAHFGTDSILAAQSPKIFGRLRPHHEFHSLVHFGLGFPRHTF
jgi:hypothetical protein